MIKYTLYVGADNSTGELDMQSITEECDKVLQGYTILKGDGYWEKTHEAAAAIVAVTSLPTERIIQLAAALRERLNQYAVCVESHPVTFESIES